MLLPGASAILIMVVSIVYVAACFLIGAGCGFLLERVFEAIVRKTKDHKKYWSGAGEKYYHWYFQVKNRFLAIFWTGFAVALYTLFGVWYTLVERIYNVKVLIIL